jgi:hypothetical protein
MPAGQRRAVYGKYLMTSSELSLPGLKRLNDLEMIDSSFIN